MTDPSVKEMNNTQWLFELESLYHKEETRYEEMIAIGQIIKHGVATMLGLNLMPVEDKAGVDSNGDDIIKYRRPNENEYLPLALLTGREEVIGEIVKRQKDMADQIELDHKEASGEIKHRTAEELDEFMHDEDDMVFNNPEEMRKYLIWKSQDTKNALKSLVTIVEKEDSLEQPPKEE